MAASHIREIRRVQPHGPYLIGGECLGGVVAFEIAQQLLQQGEEVGVLVLMDTFHRIHLLQWYTLYSRANRALGSWVGHLRFVPYRARRVGYHLSQLARLRGAARRGYLAQKTRKAKELLGGTAEPAGAADSTQDPRVVRSYWRAIFAYCPENYPGRIALLVNETWHRPYPDLGWQHHARAGVEVYPLAGNHETFIRENIRNTAECLRACLARAQG